MQTGLDISVAESYTLDRRYPNRIPFTSALMDVSNIKHRWTCPTSGSIFASGTWRNGPKSGAFAKSCKLSLYSPLRMQCSIRRSSCVSAQLKYMRSYMGRNRRLPMGEAQRVLSRNLVYHEAPPRTRRRTRTKGRRTERCHRICSLT